MSFTELKQRELNCEARVWALKDALKVAQAELEQAREAMGKVDGGLAFTPVSSECTVKMFKHLAQCVRESVEWKQRPSRCTITAEEATRALLEAFHPTQLQTTKYQKPNTKKVFKQFVNPAVSQKLLATLIASPTLPKVTTVLQLPEDPNMSLHIDVDVKDLPVMLDGKGAIEMVEPKVKKSFIGNSVVRTRQGQKSSLVDVPVDDIVTIMRGAKPVLKSTPTGLKWHYQWKSITLSVKPIPHGLPLADDASESDSWRGSFTTNSPSSATSTDLIFSAWEASVLSPQAFSLSKPLDPPPLEMN